MSFSQGCTRLQVASSATRHRPVPAFLMLDQPSQAYYPPDRDVGDADVHDEDQIAVTRLYRLLQDYCATTESPMQIIVVDHVELLQDWFRGGDASALA